MPQPTSPFRENPLIALIGGVFILLAGCQIRGAHFLGSGGPPVTLNEVRQSLGMTATDRITRTHQVVVSGAFNGPDGQGKFLRTYEPDGSFEHHSFPESGAEQVERFDGKTLWVDSNEAGAYPMTPARAQLASSVEWTLGGRWLQSENSPFETTFQRARNSEEGPSVHLILEPGNFESRLSLHPISLHPLELSLRGRQGPLRLELLDWRTRRGFPWPYEIRIFSDSEEPTTLVTEEVRFLPSLKIPKHFQRPITPRGVTRFDRTGTLQTPLRRTPSGHILVRPILNGREFGWFLVDTGTGVNCLDPTVFEEGAEFLQSIKDDDREISIIGLGGSVQGQIHRGGMFELGPMRAEGMEWVKLDLSSLQEVVGAPLAGVLGGELFERAVVEVDFSSRTIALHDPEDFDGTRLPWKPLRFDGITPCVQCRFAYDNEGWFRLDTGSDDTVTFHSPWVRKLGLVRKARNLVQMRLRGIGGEIRAVQGRIPWFEVLGMRFTSPRVTLVENASGPLANPDLMGNLGVGFLTGQRLILDYPHHRVALIPR